MPTTTATLLPFPPRVLFSALHRFSLEEGRGAVVAVFFRVHGAELPDARHHEDDAGRDQQAQQAVVEAES